MRENKVALLRQALAKYQSDDIYDLRMLYRLTRDEETIMYLGQHNPYFLELMNFVDFFLNQNLLI